MKYTLTLREVVRLLHGKRITFGHDVLYLPPDNEEMKKLFEDYVKTRPMRMLYKIQYDSESMGLQILKRERKKL